MLCTKNMCAWTCEGKIMKHVTAVNNEAWSTQSWPALLPSSLKAAALDQTKYAFSIAPNFRASAHPSSLLLSFSTHTLSTPTWSATWLNDCASLVLQSYSKYQKCPNARRHRLPSLVSSPLQQHMSMCVSRSTQYESVPTSSNNAQAHVHLAGMSCSCHTSHPGLPGSRHPSLSSAAGSPHSIAWTSPCYAARPSSRHSCVQKKEESNVSLKHARGICILPYARPY